MSEGSAGKIRQIFLVVILLLVAAAFAYDFLVVRPAHSDAWKKVSEIDEAENSNVTSADVQEMMGFAPANVKDTDTARIETYRWRRGLPFLSYSVSVVYSKSPGDKKYYFYTATSNSEPSEKQMPKKIAETKITKPKGKLMTGKAGPGGAAKKDDDDKGKEDKGKDDKGKEDASKEAEKKEEPAADDAKKEEPSKDEGGKEDEGKDDEGKDDGDKDDS